MIALICFLPFFLLSLTGLIDIHEAAAGTIILMIVLAFWGDRIKAEDARKPKVDPSTIPWRSDWQSVLREKALQIEGEQRSKREVAKKSLSPAQSEARYMPEEMRKKLGLI